MKLNLIWRDDPQSRKQKEPHADSMNEGTITENDLTMEIVSDTALSEEDEADCVDNLFNVISKHLCMGKSVRLGRTVFNLALCNEGMDDDGFSAGNFDAFNNLDGFNLK